MKDRPTGPDAHWHPADGPVAYVLSARCAMPDGLLAAIRPPAAWMHEGSCTNAESTFRSEAPDDVVHAVQICQGCPVTAECLADAESENDTMLVRGGLTPDQLRDRQATAPVTAHGIPNNYKLGLCRCDLCHASYMNRQASYPATSA